MNYLGIEGYKNKHQQVTDARKAIELGVRELGFTILGTPLLGIIAFQHPDVDVFAIYKQMYDRGWVTSLTTQPKALHLMLSPFHKTVTNLYLSDLTESIEQVKSGDKRAVKEAKYN